MEDEGQKLHHVIVCQDGRLSQKGFQHPGTGAKAVRALTSGQAFQFALQPLLLVLRCGQLLFKHILLMLQFFKFFLAHGVAPFSKMGKTKATNFLRLIALGIVIQL